VSRILGVPASRYAPPAVLCLLAAGYLFASRQYDEQSRLMPMLIGRAMFVLAAIDVLSRSDTSVGRALLRWLNPAALSEQPQQDADARKELGYILWIIAFALAIMWIGMYVAVPAFLFLSFSLIGRRSLLQSLALSAGVGGAIWALFSLLLRLHLFPGLAFGGML